MHRISLFELLGQPVSTLSPETGTTFTRSPETYDDAGLLPSIADYGTRLTTADWETYDDDALLPLM